jgi:hypothetical protein
VADGEAEGKHRLPINAGVNYLVKIGNWTLFERTKKTVEAFKASVDTGLGGGKPKRQTFSIGQHSWLSRCQHFEQLAQDYPLFNQSCLALAGMVMSQGVFHKPAVNKNDETYALAEEAMWRCEKVARQFRVNSKFYETILRMAKYGSCFWEVTFAPEFGFRLAPSQENIEPAEVDEVGNITKWRQVTYGTTSAEWSAAPQEQEAYLINVAWNVTPQSWPYGTSLGTGSETELEALIEMESNAKDYMDKQAWPYEILALGNENSTVLDSDYQVAKTEWKNRRPGEGIATRNMPVQVLPGGTGSAPIRELSTLCQLMKDNAHDGLMVAPISKLYNSTEASAKVLTQHVMTTLGQPMQWIVKELYEEKLLKPFLERVGFSVKSCPEVLFESPDVHKKEEGEYWVGLVGAKIQSPKQAADHLGLEYDEAFWRQEQQRIDKQFQQKAEGKGANPSGEGEKRNAAELIKEA